MAETTRLIIEGVVSIILVGRGVLSHYEHKKTQRDVIEIKMSINGEVEKRIEEARQKGIKEGIEMTKNKSL